MQVQSFINNRVRNYWHVPRAARALRRAVSGQRLSVYIYVAAACKVAGCLCPYFNCEPSDALQNGKPSVKW